MQTFSFEGTLTALSSVTHNGGQSFGINAKLRREKFVQPDGRVEEVPTLSGNGLRGILRDRGMLHMCRLLGYGVSERGDFDRLPAFLLAPEESGNLRSTKVFISKSRTFLLTQTALVCIIDTERDCAARQTGPEGEIP